MKANGRRFNGKQSYPIPIWNGLLEHRDRMGAAIWEFIWCLDRITQEKNGVGIVSGGAPVRAKQIAQDFVKESGEKRGGKGRNKTVDEDTVRINLKKLEKKGYLLLRRTPYGQVIKVPNSRKFGIWTPCKRTDENPDSLTGESRETPTPESRKTPETKKTQQTTRSKENPLYKKEGFPEFWKEYPREEDKEDAAKVWAKIEPEEHPSIMAGLKRWKRCRQWQKDGGEFIVYAVRFLKKKKWKETPVDLQRQEAEHREEREMVKARVPA